MISTIVTLATSTSSSAALNHTTLLSLTPSIELNTTTSNYLYTPSTTIDLLNATTNDNDSSTNGTLDMGSPVFPGYIRTTSMVFCIIIMCLGVVGNVMVPIVIFKTKDMRNSTNIFLVNLSVADLMVLLVCTPTVLVEVNSKPETWVLGKEMCKAVPFVELTVAHASVLTILAISFERYYAICKPLEAGYICTKARASLICLLAWIIAAVFTSPILAITQYSAYPYFDGSIVFVCFSLVEDLLPCLFFIISIIVFFIFPLAILICIYALIAKTLMDHPTAIITGKSLAVAATAAASATTTLQAATSAHCTTTVPSQSVIKYRKQVILMLGTVVLAFFICLLPFRALTLWIIIAPAGSNIELGMENYYNILYFSRIMFHINSAVNPILYNIMSSKFRGGFLRLCGVRNIRKRYKRKPEITRKSTSSSTHTSSQQTSDSFLSSKRNHSCKYSNSLKEVKEVVEDEFSRSSISNVTVGVIKNHHHEKFSNNTVPSKHVYIRAPIQIINGISGQRLPSGEIYV